jgi:hypothetical protein
MLALGISCTRLPVLRHLKDCESRSFDVPVSFNDLVVGGMLADLCVVPIAPWQL